MKLSNSPNQSTNLVVVGIVVSLAALALAGAVNGAALTSSTWSDSIITWIKTNFLASTFLILLATIMTVMGVAQMAKGGNYAWLLLGLGLIVVAVLAPGWWTTISTTVPTDVQIQTIDNANFVIRR